MYGGFQQHVKKHLLVCNRNLINLGATARNTATRRGVGADPRCFYIRAKFLNPGERREHQCGQLAQNVWV